MAKLYRKTEKNCS